MRSPVDVVRLLFAAVVLGGALVLARKAGSSVASFEDDLLRALSRLVPLRPRDAAVGMAQGLAVAVPVAVGVVLLASRRLLAFVLAVAAAALAAAATVLLERTVLDDTHPFGWPLALVTPSWLTTLAFPGPGYLAGAAAVAAVLAPWMSRPWRRVAWGAVVVLVLVRVVTRTELPLDAVIAPAVGLGVGALVLLVVGAPVRRPSVAAITDALAATGVTPVSFDDRDAGPLDDGVSRLRGVTAEGAAVRIEVRSPDDRTRDLLYRAWRRARPRRAADRCVFTSLRAGTEHQALVATWARRAGARTPQVLAVGETSRGDVVLVTVDRGERPLAALSPDELTDGVLTGAWAEMAKLHAAGIAHGSPTLYDAYLDRSRRVGLWHLRHAQLNATARRRDSDTAQLLVATARIVGRDRALAAAAAGAGAERLAAAGPHLHPVALEQATGVRWRDDEVMSSLREELAVGSPAAVRAVGARITGRAVAVVVVASLAFYAVLPWLARASGIGSVVRGVDLGRLVVALVAVPFLYAASALALVGAADLRVPFIDAYRLQLQAAFANLFSPYNRGGVAVTERFLGAAGLDDEERESAIVLTRLASGVGLAVLFVALFAWSENTPGPELDLPSTSSTLVVIAAVLAVAGLVAGLWRVRRRTPGHLRAVAQGGWRAARLVFVSPGRVGRLLVGALAEPLLQMLILVVSVRAFGGTTSFSDAGACYVVARAIASLAPTPGGTGAYEAALIAALTGMGVDPPTATAAVLTQRALGYWLVLLPGWWVRREAY